ncbi:hypothetical protein ONE63_011524 [Megalurothrips usitatus]|uniref:Uncharacterized protein n=1 Tax=Megalurothrips usitatus TaxID=439358 RepID=A0AAV7X3M9_9NEOP|nr:hypothetical protein ONE63_011524 [Megalurothrips usitatus]
MYVMASIKFKIKMIHRYLETGHTQMQCDAMHARIENHMKNTDVHHPSQWIVGMKMAKIQEPKYIVKEMLQEELFDFSPLVSYQSWQNIRTSTIREIVFCGSEPGKVYFKTLFDENAVFAQVLYPRPGRPVNWSTIKLKRKYSAKFPVRPDVLKGLQDLCKSGAIKEEYQPFYVEFLPSIGRKDEEVDSEYSDECMNMSLSDVDL